MKPRADHTHLRRTAVALVLLAAVGCDQQDHSSPGASSSARSTAEEGTAVRGPGAPVRAIARLSPTRGSDARGEVSFRVKPEGLELDVSLSGLQPGKHGFHVHSNGDCSSPNASSADGHFNPTNAAHGGPQMDRHHVGDLGNIEANAQGRIDSLLVFESLALDGERGILGRALIVHKGRDDLETQPAGDAGDRVACGVIRGANERARTTATAQDDASRSREVGQ